MQRREQASWRLPEAAGEGPPGHSAVPAGEEVTGRERHSLEIHTEEFELYAKDEGRCDCKQGTGPVTCIF